MKQGLWRYSNLRNYQPRRQSRYRYIRNEELISHRGFSRGFLVLWTCCSSLLAFYSSRLCYCVRFWWGKWFSVSYGAVYKQFKDLLSMLDCLAVSTPMCCWRTSSYHGIVLLLPMGSTYV